MHRNTTVTQSMYSVTDFEGCGFGIDTEWGIAWANILVGEVDRQPCPGDAATLGY